ncbi:MAG: aminotransferase class I/II-fold pyridoxal phosphate-dependent enzyme, partial [Pseudomonadota bacterium]
MSETVFDKPFTQQEGMPDAVIERAVEILKGGRLHRYNTVEGEIAEAALLEDEYAEYQGTNYCIACTSGGYAMQVALRSVGMKPGDKILANAYTLAPVPGAIHAAGGSPVFIEIDQNWHTDIDDLRSKAKNSGAKFMLLSHMRGHIADMEAVTSICEEYGI